MVDTVTTFFDRIRLEGKPVANPYSIVTCGQARFTVLTSRLIRLEWSEAGQQADRATQFEDRATFAFPNRYTESPAFLYEITGNQVEIKTEALTLHYINDGQPFNAENLSIQFTMNGQAVKWTPGMTNEGNLGGTLRTLDQYADAASLQPGLLSRDGWSLFDDSASPVWDRSQYWVEARPDRNLRDWYFFGYGHDYKAALSDYIQFGGAIPLIPRYVLGAWWSRFWAYSADDLKQLVGEFESHEVPLDVLVIDMDWHTPDGWTGYTWNRQLFPDPTAFLEWVHEQDLYATLNLHPADGIQKHEEAYAEFATLLNRDPGTGEGIKFTCTDKAFIQHYFEVLHHPMEDQGVDFWWLDWQQGESTNIRGLDPLGWLNHLHFKDSTRRATRPMLYSRWGGLGNHRYPIGFSGDTYATWESLRFQSYFTPTAANVAYGWWSHDIGGHFGATDPELYARWVQFGAVSPCLRLHSTKDPLAERRPWAFSPEVYAAAKAAIQFRYRLLPYLYSVARSTSEQGLSLCYPMYYEYPNVEDAYLAREQYFLGDQMFVAPITRPTDPLTGLAHVDVWIPEGNWIEFTTLESFTGPRWSRVEADLNRIPMFVKAGAIVPLAPQIMRTREFDGSDLTLMLFPTADGRFELYEDDGTTEAYKYGTYQTTAVRSTLPNDKTIVIDIAAAEGYSPELPTKRTITLQLRGVNKPSRITVADNERENEHTGWSYNDVSRELVITIKDTDRRVPLTVTVSADQKLSALASDSIAATPFVHFLDYVTHNDAKKQLGTAIIVPPTDVAFDLEITWSLHKGDGVTTLAPLMIQNCVLRQILHSPFKDDGDCETFRWSAAVTVRWQGQSFEYSYHSQDAYPAIKQWQTLIYNREEKPLSINDLVSLNGNMGKAFDWLATAQDATTAPNIKQPFGVILLERERERIISGEPLEACVTTSIHSNTPQDKVLYLQAVGEATCYLNGTELTLTEPVAHAKMLPMLPSWMPPKQKYYNLPLREGANQLVIFTHPDTSINWWGLGASVLDRDGVVMTNVYGQTSDKQP